ncbi:MAG TPA: hypothetical protein VMZ53_14930 [Kofleriaceae bacterium]|nr:hypothetical protein [Kofleriaceae bacterium]
MVRGGALALLLGMAVATPAWADEPVSPVTFHKGQFGGSVRFGVGARGIATYENSVYCGKTDPQAEYGFASVCTGRTPLALDLEAAYGVTGAIELTLELRIGIESDFGTTPSEDGPRPFHVAPGARFFFSEAARSKLFVQPELVFDFAGYDRGNDFGVRGIEGYWIDLHKTYGLYFFVAETLEFSRWLSASFEAGVGFQGRYP